MRKMVIGLDFGGIFEAFTQQTRVDNHHNADDDGDYARRRAENRAQLAHFGAVAESARKRNVQREHRHDRVHQPDIPQRSHNDVVVTFCANEVDDSHSDFIKGVRGGSDCHDFAGRNGFARSDAHCDKQREFYFQSEDSDSAGGIKPQFSFFSGEVVGFFVYEVLNAEHDQPQNAEQAIILRHRAVPPRAVSDGRSGVDSGEQEIRGDGAQRETSRPKAVVVYKALEKLITAQFFLDALAQTIL